MTLTQFTTSIEELKNAVIKAKTSLSASAATKDADLAALLQKLEVFVPAVATVASGLSQEELRYIYELVVKYDLHYSSVRATITTLLIPFSVVVFGLFLSHRQE